MLSASLNKTFPSFLSDLHIVVVNTRLNSVDVPTAVVIGVVLLFKDKLWLKTKWIQPHYNND